MKNKISYVVILFLIGACSNIEISHVSTSGELNENGLYYALPMTVLTIDAPVTKITIKPGACFCSDEELMRSKGEVINDLIDAYKKRVVPSDWASCERIEFDETKYIYHKLGDITITSYPVPDSTKIFFVNTRKNIFKKNNLTFVLNELGVLNSAEIKSEDRTLDVVTQVVGSVAEVAGKFMKGADDGKRATMCAELKTQLKSLIDARIGLITNRNSQTSIETIKKQLEEIDKAQQAIISQFTFVEEKETTSVKIDRVVKTTELNSWINLFTFDKVDGLKLLATPQNGYTNFYHNNGAESVSSPAKDIYAMHVQSYGAQLPGYAGRSTAAVTEGAGLAYNIPKKAAIKIAKLKSTTVSNAGKESTSYGVDKWVGSTNVLMPQFGTVAFLKRNQSLVSVELDPLSGALRKVSLENNALTADQIKNAGTAAGGFAEFKKSELSGLQNEAALLEQKEKILKLKISLDSLAQVME